MGFLSGIAALGGAIMDGIGATGWLSNSAAESLNKNTAKTNLSLIKKRALEEPSWSVKGLRNAGLNPVLAASSFGGSSSSSLGGQSVNTSDPSIENPVTTALQASNLRKQNDNLDRQNDLLSAQKKQVEANTLKAISDAQLNSAKVHNTTQDTINKANTRGLSGPYAAVNQVGQDAVKLGGKVVDAIKSVDKFGRERINQPVIDFVRRFGSRFSNSAKDMRDGSAALVAPSPRMRHETGSSARSMPGVRRAKHKHN